MCGSVTNRLIAGGIFVHSSPINHCSKLKTASMYGMHTAQLKPCFHGAFGPRMRDRRYIRQPFTCANCRKSTDEGHEHDSHKPSPTLINQRLAAVAAAALLMV